MRKLEIADPEIMRIANKLPIFLAKTGAPCSVGSNALRNTDWTACAMVSARVDRRAWIPSSGLRWSATWAAAPLISVMLDTCGTAGCCPHTSCSATRSLWACVNVNASSDKWGFACVSLDHR